MSAIRSRGRRGSSVVPNWRWEDPALDPYELRIAGWIASHTDTYCGEHVTRNEIARRTGMSAGKTSTALTRLMHLGIISIEREPQGRGGGDRFVITFDHAVWETPGEEAAGHDTTSMLVTTRPAAGHHVTGTIGDHVEDHEESLAVAAAPALGEKPINRQRNEIWDALTELFGPAETRSAQGIRGKVVRSLKEAGATPHDVKMRARAWPHKFPSATLTEFALEKHWSLLGQPTPPKMSGGMAALVRSRQRYDERNGNGA